MSDLFTKLHGTTTDSFKIGLKNVRLSLTGVTDGITSTVLKNREDDNFSIVSTVFFTAYIIGRGNNNSAAYEIKGCYIEGTTTISGYVVNTYVDSVGFTDPSISFSTSGELFVECFGILGDTINWTAVVDAVAV
jgi:hypothetical protein